MLGDKFHTQYSRATRATFGPKLGAEMIALASTSVSTWFGRRCEHLKSAFTSKPKQPTGHVNLVPTSKMEVGVEEMKYVPTDRSEMFKSAAAADSRSISGPNLTEILSKISGVFVSLRDTLFPKKQARVVVNLPSFEEFLTAKATSGFTPSDKLSFSYIRWIDSKGLASIGAFFAYELKAVFGTGKFNIGDLESNNNAEKLRQMNDFYMQLGKTEKVFAQFSKKPDAEKYKAAAEAFEALHQFIENIPGAKNDINHANGIHQLMNSMLNKAVDGNKDVAEVLLKYFATAELTKNGGFSQDNLLRFYAEYAKTVANKQAAGYGVAGMDQNGNLPSANDIKEDTIRMVFAHVLKGILNKNGEGSAEWTEYDQMIESLVRTIQTNDGKIVTVGNVNDEEIALFVGGLNERLLKVMETDQVDPSLYAFVDKRTQKRMIKLYKDFGIYNSKVLNLGWRLSQAETALKEAQKAFDQSQAVTITCAFTMLNTAWGNKEPQGFEKYSELNRELIKLHGEIRELTQESEGTTQRINGENAEEIAHLTTQITDAQVAFDTAQDAVWGHEEAYNNALANTNASSAKIPAIRFDFGVLSNDQEIDITAAQDRVKYAQYHAISTREKQAHEALQTTLNKKKTKLEETRKSLASKQEEIKVSITKAKEDIHVQLEKARNEVKEIKGSSITVTGAQLVLAEQDEELENLPALKKIAEDIETKQQFVNAMATNVANVKKELIAFVANNANRQLLQRVADSGYKNETLNYVGFNTDNVKREVVPQLQTKNSTIAYLLRADVSDTESVKSKAVYMAHQVRLFPGLNHGGAAQQTVSPWISDGSGSDDDASITRVSDDEDQLDSDSFVSADELDQGGMEQ